MTRNTAVVTINGSYYRRGSDTLKTRSVVRTHNNTLSATFTDVTRARPIAGAGGGISGTISGTYTASITFSGPNDLYKERSVEKTFSITLDGTDCDIDVGGMKFAFGWRFGEKR